MVSAVKSERLSYDPVDEFFYLPRRLKFSNSGNAKFE